MDLKEQLERAKDILRRALPYAYHSNECDLAIDQTKLCNCWVIEAYELLEPISNKQTDVKINDFAECSYCKHTHLFHSVRMDKELACSFCGCQCMKFVPPKEE